MITVREASAEDIALIRELAHATWPVSYKDIITDEQISYMLNLIYSEAALIDQVMVLKHQFLIALENDRPVGFASYSPKPNDDEGIFRLNKLYLLPDQQGKGSGKILLQHVIDHAKEGGATSLELNVNKENPAIGFYKKNGFSITREEVLDIGNDFVMDDFIMTKRV